MKRLIDVDDDALERAQRALGLPTIKATVNAALRLAGGTDGDAAPPPALDDAIDTLAALNLGDRTAAWR